MVRFEIHLPISPSRRAFEKDFKMKEKSTPSATADMSPSSAYHGPATPSIRIHQFHLRLRATGNRQPRQKWQNNWRSHAAKAGHRKRARKAQVILSTVGTVGGGAVLETEGDCYLQLEPLTVSENGQAQSPILWRAPSLFQKYRERRLTTILVNEGGTVPGARSTQSSRRPVRPCAIDIILL